MKKKTTSFFDYQLFGIILFLIAFGLIMLYSTSSYNAQLEQGDSMFYLKKQAFSTLLGFVAMFAAYKVDYHVWYRFGSLWLVAACIFVALTKTPIGVTLNGASRWIRLPGFTIQPAEFAKLAIIIFIAILICKISKNVNNIKAMILVFVLSGILAAEIFVLNDNLSTAIIVMGIVFVMYFVSNRNYSWYIVLMAFAVAGFVGLMIWFDNVDYDKLGNFRLERFAVWRRPEAFAKGKGFQVLQGLYAIGSGGLFGKGLGNSIQKLGFIPEAQNDMIFAIICEELGLFGAICVIIVFLILIWRLMLISSNAPDLFGSMIAVGIMAHIAIQVILNIAVVTNAIPNTGVTLPFISYGGTSVIFIMAELGIALNVSRQITVKKQ